MCLILGTPGSGCTTFLKTIANRRQGFFRIGGNVRYAGIDAQEMAKTYKGEIVYNAEGAFSALLLITYLLPWFQMISTFPPSLSARHLTLHSLLRLQDPRGAYRGSLAPSSI